MPVGKKYNKTGRRPKCQALAVSLSGPASESEEGSSSVLLLEVFHLCLVVGKRPSRQTYVTSSSYFHLFVANASSYLVPYTPKITLLL